MNRIFFTPCHPLYSSGEEAGPGESTQSKMPVWAQFPHTMITSLLDESSFIPPGSQISPLCFRDTIPSTLRRWHQHVTTFFDLFLIGAFLYFLHFRSCIAVLIHPIHFNYAINFNIPGYYTACLSMLSVLMLCVLGNWFNSSVLKKFRENSKILYFL